MLDTLLSLGVEWGACFVDSMFLGVIIFGIELVACSVLIQFTMFLDMSL